MQTSPAAEQNKTLNGPGVRGISPVGKEKVYGGNDLPKSQVLSSEWKTERVREDASGDREDGEEDDDELPCVIHESEWDCNNFLGPFFRGRVGADRYCHLLRDELTGWHKTIKVCFRLLGNTALLQNSDDSKVTGSKIAAKFRTFFRQFKIMTEISEMSEWVF